MINYADCPVKFSREESFKLVLNKLSEIENPTIIEIGCIRSINDLGAGNSSELFAWFVSKFGGKFITCDIDYDNLQLCRSVIENYKNDKCEILTYNADGIDFLKQIPYQADLLYLDAMDAEADHFMDSAVFHFNMFKAYENKIKSESLILIDDILNEQLHGKGFVLIPYLILEKKYEVLYSGYQWLFKVR